MRQGTGSLTVYRTKMPLSKARNRRRMRLIRLHKLISPPKKVESVQPKPTIDAISPSIKREGYGKASSTVIEIDADGQPILEYT